MAGCCPSGDYHRFFNQRFARRLANRYCKRGLDKTARTMVQFLQEVGIEGASVLEIGGGVGEIEVELLQAGAARAQNLELSPACQGQARTLAGQAGVQGAWTGGSMIWPRTPGRWRRPTWWSCTGWPAATRTMSACSALPPPTMRGAPWSSAIHTSGRRSGDQFL